MNTAVSQDVTADCITASQPPSVLGDVRMEPPQTSNLLAEQTFQPQEAFEFSSVGKSCDTGPESEDTVFFGSYKTLIWCYCT